MSRHISFLTVCALTCSLWNPIGLVAQEPPHTTPQLASPANAGSGSGTADACRLALDEATAAFRQGDVEGALQAISSGLTQCPGNVSLIQFHSLVLFAKGNYQEASNDAHRVVAAGQSWKWSTICGVYPGIELYTKHLRALEAHARKHPDDGAARFLLAYHYKVGGHEAAAVRELEMVVRLEFNDPIAVEFLRRLPKAGSRTFAQSGY
jgi:thioredoxin-like negative regulator of GroEL